MKLQADNQQKQMTDPKAEENKLREELGLINYE